MTSNLPSQCPSDLSLSRLTTFRPSGRVLCSSPFPDLPPSSSLTSGNGPACWRPGLIPRWELSDAPPSINAVTGDTPFSFVCRLSLTSWHSSLILNVKITVFTIARAWALAWKGFLFLTFDARGSLDVEETDWHLKRETALEPSHEMGGDSKVVSEGYGGGLEWEKLRL